MTPIGTPGNPGDPGSQGGASALGDTPPGARLLRLVTQAAGPGRRYQGLDDSEVVVAIGRLAALESWITSQKLAAIREIIRRRPAAGHEPETSGGLPGLWQKDLDEELACELAITRNAAGDQINLGWVLEARLPLTAAALDAGILDLPKVRMIAAETSVLSDQDAREAEKLIADKWARKTWGQLRTLVVRAVVNIDPDGARKRREQSERDYARVRLWREHAGTAGLAGYGLPTERALIAHAILQARARDYRAWGIPGTLDQLRAMAYLDLLTGRDSRTQYPRKGSDPRITGQDGTGPADTGRDGKQTSSGSGDQYGTQHAPGSADRDTKQRSPGSGGRDTKQRSPGSGGRDTKQRSPGSGGQNGSTRPAGDDRDYAADVTPAPDPSGPDDVHGNGASGGESSDDRIWDEPRDDAAWDDGTRDDNAWDDGTRGDDAWDDGTREENFGDDEDWDDRNWNDELGGDGSGEGESDGNDDDGPGGGNGGGSGGGGSGGPGGKGGPDGGAAPNEGLPANVDLTIPLPCLTEHAQRAGEAHGLGVLDPGLARRLAAEAARHPRSVFRIIVTDPHGHAVGFGQASRIRKRRPRADEPPSPGQDNRGGIRDGTDMPPVTFTPASDGQGTLFPDHADGPPDPATGRNADTGWAAANGGGRDTWTLTIGDQAFSVRLLPIPDGECDHRYESRGYQPSETLRRLVQIRDGECTMPICVRHPRGCDWEHAVPWPGGRTCSCNGGARCRHDHMIKQSPRWNVEQLPGGLHRWTAPSGLTYTKGPKEYPF